MLVVQYVWGRTGNKLEGPSIHRFDRSGRSDRSENQSHGSHALEMHFLFRQLVWLSTVILLVAWVLKHVQTCLLLAAALGVFRRQELSHVVFEAVLLVQIGASVVE